MADRHRTGRVLPDAAGDTPKRSPTSCVPPRGHFGPAAGCSWASGLSHFAALGFAYFYLRSANNADLWRPAAHHGPHGSWSGRVRVRGSRARSSQVTACGVSRRAPRSTGRWRAGRRFCAALTAVSLQIWQLTELPFFPGRAVTRSCFVGWAGMNIVMLLSGGVLAEDPACPTAAPAPRGHRRRGGWSAPRCRLCSCFV